MNKFWSSPAWTMGKRYPSQIVKKDNPNLGPGSYGIKINDKNTPSWKIGTGNRQNSKTDGLPGPGAYQLSKNMNGPKISIATKLQNKQSEKNPGPGAYDANHNAVFKNPQGCTLGSKYSNDNKNFIPGPGSYYYENKLNTNQAVKIGKSKRQVGTKDHNPGPGTYQYQRPFSAGPKYGFAKSDKSKIKADQQYNPGPGQYQMKHFLQQNKGISLSWKNNVDNQSKTPGPGQYNIGQNRPQTAGIKIGTSNRYSQKQMGTPGPGHYTGNYNNKNGPAIKIGSSLRSGVIDNMYGPGPGTYEVTSGLDKHGVTINGNRKNFDGDQYPGPGTYQVQINSVKQRPATAKIGKGQRSGLKQDDNPGPGYYNLNDGNKPKFAFNKQQRSKYEKGRSPGPADYEIPSSIPNVPNYIMSSIQSKSKSKY